MGVMKRLYTKRAEPKREPDGGRKAWILATGLHVRRNKAFWIADYIVRTSEDKQIVAAAEATRAAYWRALDRENEMVSYGRSRMPVVILNGVN